MTVRQQRCRPPDTAACAWARIGNGLVPDPARRPSISARPASIARSTASMSVGTALSRVTGFVRTWAMAVALGVTLTSTARSRSRPRTTSRTTSRTWSTSCSPAACSPRCSSRSSSRSCRRDGEEASVPLRQHPLLGRAGDPRRRRPRRDVLPAAVRLDADVHASRRGEAELAVYLFRFFAVQIVFYGFCAITTGILNSYRQFVAPAIAPVANNVVVIIVLLGVYLPLRDNAPRPRHRRPRRRDDARRRGAARRSSCRHCFKTRVPVPAGRGTSSDPTLRKLARKTVPILVFVIVNLVGVSFRNAFATQAFLDGSGGALLRLDVVPATLRRARGRLHHGPVPRALRHGGPARTGRTYKATVLAGAARACRCSSCRWRRCSSRSRCRWSRSIVAGAFSADAVPTRGRSCCGCGRAACSRSRPTCSRCAPSTAMQDSLTPMFTNMLATVAADRPVLAPHRTGAARRSSGIPLADAIYLTVHWLAAARHPADAGSGPSEDASGPVDVRARRAAHRSPAARRRAA